VRIQDRITAPARESTTMKLYACIVLIVISVSTVVAQDANGFNANGLLWQLDSNVGGGSYQTVALFGNGIPVLNYWEFWAFNVNDDDTLDLEFGTKITRVVKSDHFNVDLYGYGVWWPATDDVFVMPWLTIQADVLGGQFQSYQAQYIPLTGGPSIYYSCNTEMLWKTSESTDVGLAAHWWDQGGSYPVHWGFKASKKVGDASIAVRYCPFGGGGDTIRVSGFVSF
jgi:hypothetical protein